MSIASLLESGISRISRIKENVFDLNLRVKYKSNKEKKECSFAKARVVQDYYFPNKAGIKFTSKK
jgi:hypothetical protein